MHPIPNKVPERIQPVSRQTVKQAVSFFFPQENIGDVIADVEPLGGGIINDTWRIRLQSGNRYILQRLNPLVFPDPSAVQENLRKVTEHLHTQLPKLSHLYNRNIKLFHPVANREGAISYQCNGTFWRMLTSIDHTCSLQTISCPRQAEEIGATLGLFHQLLASLPSASLTDPLPNFHNTPGSLQQYDQVLKTSRVPQAIDCQNIIDQHRGDVFFLENARKQGTVRQQIIHADPKVANFLFSTDAKRVISLIDLDTVKPGLLLYDIGDCLRSCCNPLGEEVKNPDDIIFQADLFTAAMHGYLTTAADLLTVEDRRLLVDSVWLISFELGLRFYSDYLSKNCYFKVEYPEQNLFRARIQFALARSIERQYEQLCRIIS
ncbi:MAG: aminoglycoside phosphotransferase family protein [Candidatus Electrothrix sp. AW5]|nr:aminoglycoside phosphotransferase family protein [Candidatus Electrothrix gigas]